MKRFFILILALVLALGALPALAAEKVTPAPTMTPPPLEPALPEPVAAMLDVARQELLDTNLQKLPRTNKYSVWYFNDKRRIGWCSTFIGWCAEQAGMPMVKESESTLDYPLADLFFPKEAKVILALNALKKAGRFSDYPQPGYIVVYGVLGSTPATHIALVESVKDLGNGVYELTTLEGNVADTVKRFCYRYILTPKQKYINFKAVPQGERIRDDAQYKLHAKNWYIVGFGQTWVDPAAIVQPVTEDQP